MANIVYFEKFKNLINMAEEHGTSLGLHIELLRKEATNPNSPTDDEKEITKAKFFGSVFILKACQFWYQKLNNRKKSTLVRCIKKIINL